MISSRVVKSPVGERYGAFRLDDYLSTRFNYRSREQWSELVGARKILVNGTAVECSHVLSPDDEITFIAEFEEPKVDLSYRVVYDDEYFSIIDKAADLPCHPAGAYFRHTLWYLLGGEKQKIHFVNRLDRETSGLVIVAKDAESARRLGRTEIEKSYLTLVHGDFPDELAAEGFIGKCKDSAVRKKRCFSREQTDFADKCEYALTLFKCLRRRDGKSLLSAVLRTGRTHQIRATLCSLGYPVVGDKLYGRDENIYLRFIAGALTDNDLNILELTHQALHAFSLEFTHPYSQEHMRIEALPLQSKNTWFKD